MCTRFTMNVVFDQFQPVLLFDANDWNLRLCTWPQPDASNLQRRDVRLRLQWSRFEGMLQDMHRMQEGEEGMGKTRGRGWGEGGENTRERERVERCGRSENNSRATTEGPNHLRIFQTFPACSELFTQGFLQESPQDLSFRSTKNSKSKHKRIWRTT